MRDTVPLNLKAGVNQVSFTGATAYLEPSSVVLRDPAGKEQLQILEQNYRADTVSQEMLLTLNEGKTIQFEVINQAGGQTKRELISGKIIRSGSGAPQGPMAWYGPAMGYGGRSRSSKWTANYDSPSLGSRFSRRWRMTPF